MKSISKKQKSILTLDQKFKYRGLCCPFSIFTCGNPGLWLVSCNNNLVLLDQSEASIMISYNFCSHFSLFSVCDLKVKVNWFFRKLSEFSVLKENIFDSKTVSKFPQLILVYQKDSFLWCGSLWLVIVLRLTHRIHLKCFSID